MTPREYKASIEDLQGIHVFQAADSGDPTVQNVLDSFIDHLAIGLANLIKMMQAAVPLAGYRCYSLWD